jgi:hypothetical protein
MPRAEQTGNRDDDLGQAAKMAWGSVAVEERKPAFCSTRAAVGIWDHLREDAFAS